MKAFGIFIFTALYSITGFSQDTLYTSKGKIITGQVTEITQHEIKYKRAANPDGPLYVIDKTDIVLIQYKNGTKEVFENTSSSGTVNSNQSTNSPDPVYVNTRPRVNVIVNPLPYVAYGGWGWGGYYNRSYYGHHHGHYGHYGWRGHR